MINCFTSKENEQIGFEIKSNRKLTTFLVNALVEGISHSTEFELPYTSGFTPTLNRSVLYRNERKKYLLAGEPLPRVSTIEYNLLDSVTSEIKDGKIHKITIKVECNELETKIVKNYYIIFNSWDKIDFYEE